MPRWQSGWGFATKSGVRSLFWGSLRHGSTEVRNRLAMKLCRGEAEIVLEVCRLVRRAPETGIVGGQRDRVGQAHQVRGVTQTGVGGGGAGGVVRLPDIRVVEGEIPAGVASGGN